MKQTTESFGRCGSARLDGYLVTWLPWASFCRVLGTRSNRRAVWVAVRTHETFRTELRVQYADGGTPEWVDMRRVQFSGHPLAFDGNPTRASAGAWPGVWP
jgi:hypothetical protein